MRRKPDAERVSGGVPHPSWNLDRPTVPAEERSDDRAERKAERRLVTPDEIWALVDAD